MLALCFTVTSRRPRFLEILLLCSPVLLQLPVVFIFNAPSPNHFEYFTCLLLFLPLPYVFFIAAGPFFEPISRILCILPPSLVVRISSRSCHSHLNKLSGHVGTDEILPFHIRFEDCPEDFGRVTGDRNRAKRPVWQYVTLVWLER